MSGSRQLSLLAEEDKEAAEAEIAEQTKRIEFYLTEYSVELLATKMANGDFVVPSYQREFTWEDERQSRFIESVMMGLPIPFLFFWEMGDGKLEIIDGSQRLRTIRDFVLGDLQLGALEVLPKSTGFRFRDLPESRQRKIKNRSIRGIVLNEHADEQARFDMFERINTGSKITNKAEVRRGALSGPFMDLVIKLAERKDFADVAPVSEKLRKEREREEFVTRFFAYSDGLENYNDRPAQFLFDYAKRMNKEFEADPSKSELYRKRFERMLAFVRNNFPFGFRRARTGTATPRTRFEAISIGIDAAINAKPELEMARALPIAWLNGEEFSEIIGSDGANAIARLRNRINFVRDRLLEAENGTAA